MWNTPVFLNTCLHRLDTITQTSCSIGTTPLRNDSSLLPLAGGIIYKKKIVCRFRIAYSAPCDKCRSRETIAHALCDCLQHYSQRQSLSAELPRADDWPLSEHTILECWNVRVSQEKSTMALPKFLRTTGLFQRLSRCLSVFVLSYFPLSLSLFALLPFCLPLPIPQCRVTNWKFFSR